MELLFAIKYFLASMLILVVLDLLFITIFMKKFYASRYDPITRKNGDVLAPMKITGAFVWVLIAAGLTAFVVPKGAHGAGKGNVIYGERLFIPWFPKE